MSNILKFQYFITKDMRTELGRGGVAGTLPILYVFSRAPRLQHSRDHARHQSGCRNQELRFAIRPASKRRRSIISKPICPATGSSPFLKWCAARGPGLSLLKAASFLMHGDGFNGVRNFLLGNSRLILQDDSGIPLRAFPKGWDVRCYGRYVQHNETFAKYYQPDLEAVYHRNPTAPLGFAFGYHWQKEAGMLMLATPGEQAGSEKCHR